MRLRVTAIALAALTAAFSAVAQEPAPPPPPPVGSASELPPPPPPRSDPAPSLAPSQAPATSAAALDLSSQAPPPAPAVKRAAHWRRRPVQLIPELHVAIPRCVSGSESSRVCEGLKGGGGIGGTALWRVTPHLAWGGQLQFSGFRYEPPPEVGLSEPGGAALLLGLVGRLYFLDEGRFDPYVQAGLGVGALILAGKRNGVESSASSSGPLGEIGVGADFALSERASLGPYLGYSHLFADKVRSCEGPDQKACTDVALDRDGYFGGYGKVALRLTLNFGDEL